MSDSFAERLKAFTPDGSGLDRDALLFELGRESDRRGHLWPILSGLLAIGQVATLAMLFLAIPEQPSVS
jgi:hypothetical protein